MSFAHIQADFILSSVPWTSNDSFENLVFEWLKFEYQHPCKKKPDFERVLADFRNHHFNKFVHNRADIASDFVKLVCDPVTTKKEYEELFANMSAFKHVLEPLPGGHYGGVPVVVLWSLHKPSQLNNIWFHDEVGHDTGKCSQCSTSRNVSLKTQEPICPANSVWLCPKCVDGGPCHQQYALPVVDTEHTLMLQQIQELYTTFLACGQTEVSWTQHYAAHNSMFESVMTDLSTTQQQLRVVTDELMQLKQWSDNQVQARAQEVHKAYTDGQYSCRGYDLRHWN
jgi:hypothetical protein|tara:strand:- start:7104 stop:7952 length:849 start_codon:yes stop_codon:yes gene_type:complete